MNHPLTFCRFILCCSLAISPALHGTKSTKKTGIESTLKVNFQEVSAIEFLQFMSEVAKLNFVYNEEELNFSFTMVSDEETSITNILSAFIQSLRIRGFSIIEQNETLIIHQNPQIKELPKVFDSNDPINASMILPAIITKVYQVKNSPVDTIVGLIRPFLSESATIESFAERKLLILSDIAQNIESIDRFIQILDQPATGLNTKVYRAKHIEPDMLIKLGKEILAPLTGEVDLQLFTQSGTKKVFIVASNALIEKTIEIFSQIDDTAKGDLYNLSVDNIFLYKAKFRSLKSIKTTLDAIASDSRKAPYDTKEFIEMINSLKVIAPDFLFFIAAPSDIDKMKSLLAMIDSNQQLSQGSDNSTFLLYESKGLSTKNLENILRKIDKNFEQHLASPTVDQAIKNMQVLESINSILFIADPTTLSQIQSLLNSIEMATNSANAQYNPSQFLLYRILVATPTEMLASLKQLSKYLKSSDSVQVSLVDTIDHVQYLKDSNTLLFVGSQNAITQTKEILITLDTQTGSNIGNDYFLYVPKNVEGQALASAIIDIKNSLPNSSADRSFIDTLGGTKWLPSSQALLFTGDPESLLRVKDLLTTLDQPQAQPISNSTFSVYKLNNVSGKLVIDELNTLLKDIPDTPENQEMVRSLKSLKWNKETNSIVMQGSTQTIQEITDLISKLDVHAVSTSQYFIYKPQHVTPDELQKALIGISSDLESSSMSDPGLVQTLKNIKVIAKSHSIVITGSEENIVKAKEMISMLDQISKEPVNKITVVGKSTFFTYKPKYSKAAQLLREVQRTGKDLAKSDPDIASALDSGKIVEGTLVFTGTTDSLEKIQRMITTLDAPAPGINTTPKAPPEVYQNYKPIYKKGADLIQEMQEYVKHLQDKGINNPGLVEGIQELQFINGRIVVIGSQQNVNDIMKLLAEFDTPTSELGKEHTAIETIDNIGFLNYKLNFHQGSDIQEALRGIGNELQLSRSKKNEALLQAINSVQWIKVTNSLIATGDPQTLIKLKEIMETIDIPLRQVFIEVLVVETTMGSNLDFGLRWGTYGTYKNRFGFGGGNAPKSDGIAGINFLQNTQDATASQPATGASIPAIAGGSLGIVGDIILHKGQSFLSLGSLLTALRNDGTTTIVLNQKILAQDSRISRIFVGDNVPFTGSFITTAGLSQTTNANLEYRNIGVSLNITPNIGDNGIVTLEIDEEITEEATTGTDTGSTVSSQGVTGIRTSKTSMQTRAHVPDKAFVVLSGQIRDTRTKSKQGLPCLGSLPLIGAAFSETIDTSEKKNLVIFIRPEIINTTQIMKDISERQEDLFRSQTNAEQFDAGIELVKTDED